MYLIRGRFLSRGDAFDITDEAGGPVLHVDGTVLSEHHRLVLRDSTGHEVAQVHRRLATLRPIYEITVDGHKIADVRPHSGTPHADRFSIDVVGPDDLATAGSLVEHEFSIQRGDRIVATVSGRRLSIRDTYAVDVTAGEDDVLILASVLALQMAQDWDGEPR
jgi:uncharacterized protein YxjI